MLGTMFTPDRDRAKLVGFVIHLVNGWAFSLLYVAAFHAWRQATWWLGAGIGLVHAAFVLTPACGSSPGSTHAWRANSKDPPWFASSSPPGFLALNYGVQ